MKAISLIILFISSSIIAQSRAEYYPLQIGNKWVYKTTYYDVGPPSISYYSKEVIGDTTMDNGIKYSVILENGYKHYERFDTLTNEIIYYSYSDNRSNDIPRYSLNYIKDSTVNWNSSFGGMKFQITFYQIPSSDTSTINLIGDGLVSVYVSFKKYIGIVYQSFSEISLSSNNLIGYRINGKEWGHLTGVSNIKNIVPDYKLEQNYPNPFNPTTTIEFAIAKSSRVKLNVYNSLGQLITTILDKQLLPGQHKAVFDGSNYTSGVYFYQLITDNYKSTKKFILLK